MHTNQKQILNPHLALENDRLDSMLDQFQN